MLRLVGASIRQTEVDKLSGRRFGFGCGAAFPSTATVRRRGTCEADGQRLAMCRIRPSSV